MTSEPNDRSNHVTQKRERKFKTAKRRQVDLSHENYFNSDYVVARVAEITYAGVAKMLPWLSVNQIANPPRQLMDAKFARQLAIHIMSTRLDIPQRQVTRLQGRQRTSIHFALQSIDERLECDTFAVVYEKTVERIKTELGKLALMNSVI